MAHEIDTTTGRAAFFSVRQTAWHRLGSVLPEAPSFADAIRYGGLDFCVDQRRLKADDPDGYPGLAVPDAYATVRTDTETVLGVVGSRYEVLQNVDAFRVFEPLVDAGLATLETGGALRGGADVWMLARFNFKDPVIQEAMTENPDQVQPYGLVTNNHTGARGVLITETPVRVVCANTLGMALTARNKRRSVSVRHTRTVEARLVEAAMQLYGGITERYRTVAEQYRTLRESYLSRVDFTRLVLDTLAPLPELPPDGKKPRGFDGRRATVERTRARVETLWHHGAGHTGDSSAWEAYNAAAESLDHDPDLWGRGDILESLAYGSRGEKKAAVLDKLAAYATA